MEEFDDASTLLQSAEEMDSLGHSADADSEIEEKAIATSLLQDQSVGLGGRGGNQRRGSVASLLSQMSQLRHWK